MNRLLLFIMVILNISCNSYSGKTIDTIALVPQSNFEGKILILLDSNIIKGSVEYKANKHYFYVPDDGLMSTDLKLGKGSVEFYDKNMNTLSYKTNMEVNSSKDNTYQIIGPIYSGITYQGVKYKFLQFNAGKSNYLRQEGNSIDQNFIISMIEKMRLKK